MKRIAGLLATLAVTSGCMTGGNGMMGHSGMSGPMHMAANDSIVGPYGTPINMSSMGGMPPGMGMGGGIMQAGYVSDGPGSGILLTNGCANGQCGVPGAPPAGYGQGGYGQGGMVHAFNYMGSGGGNGGQGAAAPMAVGRTQVRFVGPVGATVSWYVNAQGGQPVLAPQMDMPGRYNFGQAALYRLKVSNIKSNKHPGMELYPTIEVVPSNAKTDAFLAHNAVPVEFTDEDLDQISAGNMITKVIYLPDPQFQCATGGAEEISSTRLDPGVNPIAEANRRGNILLVVYVGSIDLELKNSPGMTAPGMFGAPGTGMAPPPAGGAMVPPNVMPPMAGMTSPQTQIQGPRGYNIQNNSPDQGSFTIRQNVATSTKK